MKKLLLLSLALGMGAAVSAQVPTQVSLNSFNSPTATVYIDGSGSGTVKNIINVNGTNNDAGVSFPAQAAYNYIVTVDGSPITDPDGTGWTRLNQFPFNSGQSDDFTITQSYSPNVSVGNYEICVSLENIAVTSPTLILYVNGDPNKKVCKTFAYDFTAGVGSVEVPEISKITTSGDIMTVYVKNSSNQIRVNVLDITGRTVKTVVPSIGGQDFYQNVDVSDLSAGVYIVAIQTENGISSAQKVFIQ
jgi:hypothetical protein